MVNVASVCVCVRERWWVIITSVVYVLGAMLPLFMSMYWGSMLPLFMSMCMCWKRRGQCCLCWCPCVCIWGVNVASVGVHVYVFGGVNVASDHVNVYVGRGNCCLCSYPCVCV